MLTLEDLDKMNIEYPDVFDNLFTNSYRRFKKMMQIKIEAIRHCEAANRAPNTLMSMRQSNILDHFEKSHKPRGSRFVHEYKEKKLKRHLTKSDISAITPYS
jgi:hypothetical protein